MRWMQPIFATALALLFEPFSAHAEPSRYLCIPKAATGFKMLDTKEWVSTSFRVDDNKYLLGPEEVSGKLILTQFGERYPIGYCEEHNYDDKLVSITCDAFGHFVFNLQTMRYQRYYLPGYVSGEDDGKNTPVLEIGTCAKL